MRNLGSFELPLAVVGGPAGSAGGVRLAAGGDLGLAPRSLPVMSRARGPELASWVFGSSAPVEGFGTEESCPYLLESFFEAAFISSNLFFAELKRSSFSGTEVSRCSFRQPSPRVQVRFFAGWWKKQMFFFSMWSGATVEVPLPARAAAVLSPLAPPEPPPSRVPRPPRGGGRPPGVVDEPDPPR